MRPLLSPEPTQHWASGPCHWREKECDWSSTPHPLQASLSLLLMGPKTQIGHPNPNQTSQDQGRQALPPSVSRVACSEHGTLLMVCWHVGHHCRARERSEVSESEPGRVWGWQGSCVPTACPPEAGPPCFWDSGFPSSHSLSTVVCAAGNESTLPAKDNSKPQRAMSLAPEGAWRPPGGWGGVGGRIRSLC